MLNLSSQKICCGLVACIALFVASCNHQPKPVTKYISPAIKDKKLVHSKFTLNDVDNKLDPSCMMPLTAGIGDTAHYKGFVLGFCSTECKKDFFKDPEANLALAQLRKNSKK
jgi:YHS domain-containing protein